MLLKEEESFLDTQKCLGWDTIDIYIISIFIFGG